MPNYRSPKPQVGGAASDVFIKIMVFLLQLGLGVLAVYIVYLVALGLMKEDQLVFKVGEGGRDPRHEVLLVNGYASSSQLEGRKFDTLNPHKPNYAAITRSYNSLGGSQFSYSFWLFVDGTNSSNNMLQDKTIFLRGDRRQYTYEKSAPDPYENDSMEVTERKTDVIIKCPLVRFGNSFSDIVVEFNTHDDINHRVSLASQEQANDPTLRHNLLSLMLKKWVLFTLTFEDNVPVNDFENGIVMRFFVNDILYFTHRVSSTLKQNKGELYLFPGGEVPGCKLADLRYYNYALSFKDVKKLFEKGRPTKAAHLDNTDTSIGTPLYLSEYNKLDLYNR